MVYEWISMKSFWKVDAQTVGEVMEQIEAEQGSVTRENFLDASRPQDAPTHDLFEWDDSKAAELYRLRQSGEVIMHIAIKVVSPKTAEPETIRGFVNVFDRDAQQSKYVNFNTAMADEEMRKIVLKNAYKELVCFQNKYKQYSEFLPVFEAMAEVKESIA